MKVAVIAGTSVDTQMGVDFLKSKGLDSGFFPISNTPKEQSQLQILSKDELQSIIEKKVFEIKSLGFEKIMIYCNSLSCAIDVEKIRLKEKIHIVTPLDVYKNMAKEYKIISVMAANNQSCSGIERTIQFENKDCMVFGFGNLKLVEEIEAKKTSEELIEEFRIKDVLSYFKMLNSECFILGCTHFSGLQKKLQNLNIINIIDPSEEMFKLLKENPF